MNLKGIIADPSPFSHLRDLRVSVVKKVFPFPAIR